MGEREWCETESEEPGRLVDTESASVRELKRETTAMERDKYERERVMWRPREAL